MVVVVEHLFPEKKKKSDLQRWTCYINFKFQLKIG